MFKSRYLSKILCLIFMLNFFTFDVQAFTTTYSNSSAIGNVDIVSDVNVSVESIEAWARSKNATETFVSLAKIYKQYAESRGGVNWVLAYVQAAKETGYGRFGGVLDESYHNPCGLKNPAGGDDYDPNAHKRFDNWEQGIIAHLDHLALYAAADGYPKTSYVDSWKGEGLASNETYDPRHIGWYSTTGGIYGKAKDAISLTGSWASDPTYGIELFRLYCDATQSEYLPAKSELELPSDSTVITDGKLTIKGWALHAFGIKEVKVLVDNSQIATISTGVSRPDVNSKYPGYFNGDVSGFEETIDISQLGTGNKTLEVIVVSRNGETQSHKRNITIGKVNNLPKINNLDSPSNNTIISNDKLNIRGWALDKSGVKEVRVYVDGKDLGTVPYGTNRPDVNNVYPGYASGNNAGFDGTVDISSISDGNKKLTVKITSNDGTTQTIDRTITVNRLESIVCLDEPSANETVSSNTLKLRGWAVASSGIKEVRVYVDGKDFGTIKYGTERKDVNVARPGYPSGNNAGFDGTIDISSVSEGNKKITIKAIANDGTTQTIDRTITVNRLESIVCLDEPNANETVSSNTLKLRGWAVASSGIKEVRVYVDGKDFGTIKYGTERKDVNVARPGYPSGNNAGFDGTIDISSVSEGNKKITIKAIANDGTTQTIDRTITVNRLESIVCLDEPNANETVSSNTLKLRGWAVASSGIKEVRVYVDGKDFGTIKYGTERKDVNVARPGYPSGNNAGFDGTIDISSVSEGNKKITIKAIANDGTTQTIDRTITVNRLESIVCLDEPNANETVSSNTLKLRGWAVASSGIKEVRVYVDGKDFGTIKYGTERKDVNVARPGYPSGNNAGFDGTIDISSVSEGNKKITIKAIANDGTTQTIDRTITVNRLESIVCLDEPSTNETVSSNILKLRGWAVASSGIKEVRVYVDGKDFGTIKYGTERKDVNVARPGYPSGNNAGFDGTIDISSVSEGNKKITIKAIANDGTTQTIDRTITVNRLETRVCLDEPTANYSAAGNSLKIRGWALSSTGIKEVRVYVDGKDLGTVPYGTSRADVNNVYPGYPSGNNPGFDGTVNISSLLPGNKKLTVKITANDGTVQTIERDFTYRRANLVVIDPGHENPGGDPGASATHNGITYIESNLNLQIAVKLKAELEAKGIEVYMTRYEGSGLISTDSTESLRKRVSVANEMNADFFVSIHHNSFTSASANGFEVYYSTGTPLATTTVARNYITEDGRDLTLERSSYSSRSNTEKVQISKSVATQITNEVSSKLNMYNRGAKDSNLYVCKNTLMPSILVENGFLTNPTEAAKVSTASHQQKLAEIIAEKVDAVLQ